MVLDGVDALVVCSSSEGDLRVKLGESPSLCETGFRRKTELNFVCSLLCCLRDFYSKRLVSREGGGCSYGQHLNIKINRKTQLKSKRM